MTMPWPHVTCDRAPGYRHRPLPGVTMAVSSGRSGGQACRRVTASGPDCQEQWLRRRRGASDVRTVGIRRDPQPEAICIRMRKTLQSNANGVLNPSLNGRLKPPNSRESELTRPVAELTRPRKAARPVTRRQRAELSATPTGLRAPQAANRAHRQHR